MDELKPGKVYILIKDESGEDYLYPAASFVLLDVPQEVRQSLLRAA